jgi:hypothetical protein
MQIGSGKPLADSMHCCSMMPGTDGAGPASCRLKRHTKLAACRKGGAKDGTPSVWAAGAWQTGTLQFFHSREAFEFFKS